MTTQQQPRATSGLGAAAARGAAATFAGQGARILIQVTGVVLLARILTPNDYGIMAMVLAVIGVGEVFRDFGLSSAAIQARTISAHERDNLFWLNTGIGVALGLAVVGLSWPIAALYGDDRLQPVAAALSVTFLISGVSTQFRAHLNRDLRLGKLAGAEIAAQAAALVIGIVFALLGFGFWALVIQQVAQGVIQLIVLLAITGWFPGLPHRDVSMRSFLAFGGNLTAVQLLNYASRNVDSVVLGATAGASVLGLYNRAFQLMLLPLNQLNAPSTRIALPVLSRLQDDPVQFARYLKVGQTAMLNVLGIILCIAGAQAMPIVLISLGHQWEGAVPIFQVLAVAGIFQAASYSSYWVYLAKGLSKQNLQVALFTRPIIIVLILVGSFWGVLGVAAGYAIGLAITWPVNLWWLRRVSDAPVGSMLVTGLRTVAVYTVAAGASVLSTLWLPQDALVLRLLVGTAAVLATLALTALIVPPYRRDLASILAVPKLLRRRRGEAGPRLDDTEAGTRTETTHTDEGTTS